MTWTAGQFKQEIIKDYNNINLRMFNIGVKRQKVDIIGEKVLILAIHKRIPSLKYLDEMNRFVTRIADTAIIDAYKEQLKMTIEEKYEMKVHSVLKDYDPVTECSGTIIILDKDASAYISGL
ncbi:Na-translocating system protein MpsC family protein [Alkalihalobacillus sp. TS-13]|uniref:Na-translocating system protein MpsC family protein n=1 Tax=Alkalihalobacillus sp. TS-13 TaxID=2842455 RepID=UPI001C878345|nr:Na-translocating system protein MpsC family protein [Alkalihalobacillus sp. TS-13]